MERHRLAPDALKDVELPADALRRLQDPGVPAELRLAEFPGPTLFSSELGAGHLTAAGEGYVIGSIREGETSFAFYTLRRGDGAVRLVDLTGTAPDRPVNASLEFFLASLRRFHEDWPRLSTAETPELRDAFRAELLRIDPDCLGEPEAYWNTWLEPPR